MPNSLWYPIATLALEKLKLERQAQHKLLKT
jgi:hypothetical protein